MKDHAALREMITTINTEKPPAELAAFGALLIAHVRFEERELFNVAEKILHLE
ncbi:MAG: hypothetical protein ACAH06_06900 [Methylophilaceae bacterium]